MHDLFDGGTAVSQNQARNHDIDARLCGAVAVVGGWASMQGCLQGFVGKVRQWAHGYGCGISGNVKNNTISLTVTLSYNQDKIIGKNMGKNEQW